MVESGQPIESGLSKEQKIGFVLLLAFAFLAIGLGILQIRNNMYSHFALNNKIPNTLKEQVNTVDALRFRDTDRDGLNDFDELYVYATSPYIPDSDSDGILDGEEIKRGTNPMCAPGQDCSLTPEASAVASANSSTLDSALALPAEQPALDLGKAIQDPAQVRQMLISAGVSKDVVNKVSDAELMQMIKEIMSPSSTTGNINLLNNNTGASQKK